MPHATVHRYVEDLGGGAPARAALGMANMMAYLNALYASLHPDVLLVVGDRMEVLAGVAVSIPYHLPVVHLHGGELTAGAIDDRVRHAITKLSHVHCVATVAAAKRVARMGEEPWRIHVTGAPGLDLLGPFGPL